MARRHLQRTFDLNFNFEITRDHKKNSYERRVYESVDDRSLSHAISRNSTEKIIQGVKG